MTELQLTQEGGVMIARFTCEKIIDDLLITEIGHELLQLAEQPDAKMILDFEGVMFMSSGMMGRVVSLSKRCKANKAELRVCNIAPGIMGVFENRLLNKVFKICDSTEDALNELG